MASVHITLNIQVSGGQVVTSTGNLLGQGAITAKGRPNTHVKARSALYPGSPVERFKVPDDKVSWNVPFPDYTPVKYCAPPVLKQPDWADLPEERLNENMPKFNSMDGNVNRLSHMGGYEVVNGMPRNPVGRTGISDRGLLGKWGPNHAADPIVTRWKRGADGDKVRGSSGKNILQFVSILRGDTKEWAIPGGMADPGEAVSLTCKREFSEEALNSIEVTPAERAKISADLHQLFDSGIELYKGYVDDGRNTDNSWMETVAMNFHDETNSSVGKFKLVAGDDAVGVRWCDIDSGLKMFASHADFVKKVALHHNAHW